MFLPKEDVRFLDLQPDAPLWEVGTITEVFAHGIADLKIHGANFTATYFQWAQSPEGVWVRVPNLKVTRELTSIFGMRERLSAMLKSGAAAH